MPLASILNGVACAECGTDGEIAWWKGDEHETSIAIYATCRDCGHEYPKRFVDKGKSEDEYRQIAETQVR